MLPISRQPAIQHPLLLGYTYLPHELGRPVLVGTRSVSRNETLSRLLTERGVAHRVLNARNHAEEAAIIAEAGRRGNVTIATNMAGRGVDIRLDPSVADIGRSMIFGSLIKSRALVLMAVI